LNQSLGGVRVVKTYTASGARTWSSPRAHRLFRNIAKSMTGVSALTAFSSVIIGGIGVIVVRSAGTSGRHDDG
jgi:subfamily B ATP-binding cassette protein MsbA